jgi:hypothetical protein
MADAISTISNTLTSSPLPLLIEKLGMAVANAQAELDKNSIKLATQMADTNIRINDKDYNLLSLGFMPTFYAFTEATIEAKLAFSMEESTDFSIGGKVEVNTKVVAVSVNASYARKYEQSAEGSSSIAARLISLPPPERFSQIINQNAVNAKIPITTITIEAEEPITGAGTFKIKAIIEPVNAGAKDVIWSVASIGNLTTSINTSGSLTVTVTNTQNAVTGSITITATDKNNPEMKGTKTITIP